MTLKLVEEKGTPLDLQRFTARTEAQTDEQTGRGRLHLLGSRRARSRVAAGNRTGGPRLQKAGSLKDNHMEAHTRELRIGHNRTGIEASQLGSGALERTTRGDAQRAAMH